MTRSSKFKHRLLPHDHDETREIVDWVAFRRHEAERGGTVRNAYRCMDATVVEVKTASRVRAVGTEALAHYKAMEALEVLLKDVSTEMVSAQDGPTKESGEGQDWDDYTLVEVALFLQTAW